MGQATDSQGTVHRLTDQARLDARIKRKQKGSVRRRRIAGQLIKLQRKRRNIRSNDTHQVSCTLADRVHTVVIEDLHTQGMTQSAKGTMAAPGRYVKAKSGLNRSILASGWGQLEQRLAYKCGRLIKVPTAYTSQTCNRCGYIAKANRTTQSQFGCVDCGLQLNADHNAALNILGRCDLSVARGTGAAARRGALPLGTLGTREQDMSESVYLGI